MEAIRKTALEVIINKIKVNLNTILDSGDSVAIRTLFNLMHDGEFGSELGIDEFIVRQLQHPPTANVRQKTLAICDAIDAWVAYCVKIGHANITGDLTCLFNEVVLALEDIYPTSHLKENHDGYNQLPALLSATESETQPTNSITTTPKKETIMTRIVNVTIIDNSTGIKDDAKRLVARYTNIPTTKSDEQVKMEILMTKGVAAKLATHNKARAELVDEEILRNTGNEVMLRPVELHELSFEVTPA